MAAKDPAAPAEPGAAPPAEPGADARMDRIEATQAEQGGMLEKILERLPGKPEDPPTGTAPAGAAGNAPADIQATVRQEIAAAEQRRAAEAKAKGEDDWRKSVDETLEVVKAERAPREPDTGFRGRLRKFTIGGDQ